MNAFNNLKPELQKNLRDNAKKYDSVKRLVYRLRGTGRYSLSFDDVRDVMFWGGASLKDTSVSDVYNAIFK